MNIKQLKARLDALLQKASAHSAIDTDGMDASALAAHNDAFDAMAAEIAQVRKQIEQQASIDNAQSFSDGLEAGRGRRTPRIEGGAPPGEADGTFGYSTLGEFGQDVISACRRSGAVISERLANVAGAMGGLRAAQPGSPHLEVGDDGGAGYMVPPAMSQRIMDAVTEVSDLHTRVDVEPVSTNSVQMLRDESTPWGSTGLVARWTGENTQLSPSKLETEGSQVLLHKLYVFTQATEELLQDAARLTNRLTVKTGQAIAYKLSEAIWRGTGAGQPRGILNSGALVTVAKESGQAADTVIAANVLNMYSRMLPSSLQRAVWVANSDVFPQLPQMTIGDQPIFMPPNGLASAPFGTLLGRPILYVEHADTLGDASDISLVDFSGYYSPRRTSGPQTAMSMHLYFDYDAMAFRTTWRVGGDTYFEAPVTPDNGSATKSHFVTLAARA